MLRRLNYLKLPQPAIVSLELDDEFLIVCCRIRIALELGSNLVDEFSYCDKVALKHAV
jgi:hypothetical protein